MGVCREGLDGWNGVERAAMVPMSRFWVRHGAISSKNDGFGCLTGRHTARAGRPFSERRAVVIGLAPDWQKRPQRYRGQRWSCQTMVFRYHGLVLKNEVADCVSDGILKAGRRAGCMMAEAEF